MPDKKVEQPKGRFALVNGRIVLPDKIVAGKVVVVEGDKILDVVSDGSLGADVDRVNVGGRIVTPGLMDIHTHGALGHTFNEPTAAAFTMITQENARHGVTSLLAALATAPIPDLVRCLDFCRGWMRAQDVNGEPVPHRPARFPKPGRSIGGARVLGAYVEGPYISPAQKGALDPANIRLPDDGTADTFLAYRDVLRIMALAPELPGALELVGKLAKAGIVPAAGHSSARDTDVLAAMRLGLRHVTHIWSGQSSTVREGPWRRPGLLEASLVLEGLTVEMIADNKHLPPTLMKLAYKCIGPDRLCAISDATSGAGLPEGARFRMGSLEYEVHDGVGMMLDRTSFAGSSTLLNQMIPVLMEASHVPLPEAIRMVTLTPARVIGWQERKGSLETGKDADIAIFEDDFTAWRTMIGGRWVYAR